MKFTRHASAQWLGSGKTGNGTLTSQTNTLKSTPYSFLSRFQDGAGTNPEELVAAAHAGCFSMKLSFVIGEAGFTPERIDTRADLTFENGKITRIHLTVEAAVPGMSAEQFEAAAENAKTNCPISQLLNTEITMGAQLV